jgi:hypothetical protein
MTRPISVPMSTPAIILVGRYGPVSARMVAQPQPAKRKVHAPAKPKTR